MRQDIQLGIYQHWRGSYYLVIGTSRDTETDTEVVVYKPLYELAMDTHYCHRPRVIFDDEVQPGKRRFTFVGAGVPV